MIGGTNVQFAHDPVSDRIIVIEINPRTSRSSALASKASLNNSSFDRVSKSFAWPRP